MARKVADTPEASGINPTSGKVNHPNTFQRPSAITETIFYRAALRIPYYGQRFAQGRATPESIPTMKAAAGILSTVTDPTGLKRYVVTLIARPIDR